MNKYFRMIGVVVIVIIAVITSCNSSQIAEQTATPSMPAKQSIISTITPSAVISSTPAELPPTSTTTLSGSESMPSSNLKDIVLSGPGIVITSAGKNYLICTGSYIGGNEDIIIFDISDPNNPIRISSCEPDYHPGGIFDMELNGSILYVCAGQNFWMLDISDPYHPRSIGEESIAAIWHINIFGKYAYAPGFNGVFVLHISDPLHPYIIGEVPLPGILSTIFDHWLYTFDDHDAYIIDISKPDEPKEINSISNPFPEATPPLTTNPGYGRSPDPNFIDMAIHNSYAYIVTPYYLLIYDLHNPAMPDMIAEFKTRELTNDIISVYKDKIYLLSCSDYFAYARSQFNLIEVIDVADPTNPEEVGTINLTEGNAPRPHILTEENGYLYYASNIDNYSDIKVIDLNKTISEK